MIDGHALIHQPSSLARTIECTGWVSLSMDIEQEETEESREGTAAHWVGEQVLEQYKNNLIVEPEKYVGREAPNGIIITEHMADCAQFYVDDITRTVEHHNNQRSKLSIERTVSVPQIHTHCAGTGDTRFWCPITGTLYVWDYKHGHGSVLADHNWQLMCYAMGAINELGISPVSIVFRIIQPNCFDGRGPVREWVTTVDQVRDMARYAAQRCAEADSINATCTPGPHCRNCPATYRCKALEQTGPVVYEYLQSNIAPNELTPAQLALSLDLIERVSELVKARKDGLEEEMKRRMRNGQRVPSYGLELAYSREQWTVPVKQVIDTCKLLGVDATKPDVLKTPNQVRALLKKQKVDASVISNYAGKEPTGSKLVKNTSERANLIFKESLKNV